MYLDDQNRSLEEVEQLNLDSPISTPEVSAQDPDGASKAVQAAVLDNAVNAGEQYRRTPILIAGSASAKRVYAELPRPTTKRRLVVHAGVAVVVVAVVLGALAAVLPSSRGQAFGMNQIFQPTTSSVSSKKNQVALIAAQAATATAVTQDGFEYNGAGGKYSFAGVQTNFTLPDGTSTGSTASAATNSGSNGLSSSTGTIADSSFTNWFTPGQCTYWADYEYHHLTGHAVPWSGNADQWAYNAPSYPGWHVSSTPVVPSIIVLQGGVQGAGYGTGHVGVVEKINSDGTVATTNWNIVGWGVFTWQNYHTGAGVSFVYYG